MPEDGREHKMSLTFTHRSLAYSLIYYFRGGQYYTFMPLTLDTSRQFRSINELADLVQAISSAPSSESEPAWLEWKREADLNDRRWHALISKCIVGFANRDPIVAKQWAGGCAYMVIVLAPM